MQNDYERHRLNGSAEGFQVRAAGLLGKLLAVAAGVVVVIAAALFSLVIFALAAVLGVLVWAYLWWKTRDLRRRMQDDPPGGRVIEGEVVRDGESDRSR